MERKRLITTRQVANTNAVVFRISNKKLRPVRVNGDGQGLGKRRSGTSPVRKFSLRTERSRDRN